MGYITGACIEIADYFFPGNYFAQLTGAAVGVGVTFVGGAAVVGAVGYGIYECCITHEHND